MNQSKLILTNSGPELLCFCGKPAEHEFCKKHFWEYVTCECGKKFRGIRPTSKKCQSCL